VGNNYSSNPQAILLGNAGAIDNDDKKSWFSKLLN